MVSRRSFVRSVAIGFAAGSISGWRFGGRERTWCFRCNAAIRPHAYDEPQDRGVYCPNCGIELALGTWNLSDAAVRPPEWVQRVAQRAPQSWTFAQVPFPNSTLVSATSKPTLDRLQVFW